MAQTPPTPLSIGDRIRHARKINGFSQADLAKRVGVSQPAIANWETGVHDPRKMVLARLADVLDTPLEWLAAGARSDVENDRRPAAAYLRRALRHVPLIAFEDAARLAGAATFDPHAVAQDYIPVTAASSKIFAVLMVGDEMARVFPRNTVVVIDYADRTRADGAFYLVYEGVSTLMRCWREERGRFETHSFDAAPARIAVSPDAEIIGRAVVSIRFH